MARCTYCGKNTGYGLQVPSGKQADSKIYTACSESCRKKAVRCFRFCRVLSVPGLTVIAVSLVLIFHTGLGFSNGRRFLGVGLTLFGLFYLLFPLFNSYAAENVRLRRSRLAIHICAGLTLLAVTEVL